MLFGSRLKILDDALKPPIDEARRTFPAARDRFLAGLPKGQRFFVAKRLYDECGRFIQAYVAVTKIDGGLVEGRIAGDVARVAGYRPGDALAFPESELIDWSIVHADGTEEGNVLGRFMATFRLP